MKLIVLGSGTSHGIPVPGCDCAVCRSGDSKDKRLRSALYIEGQGGEAAVIDTGPEFRLQALRAGIRRLDAVFLTHTHADHIHGLDDVRPFSVWVPLPVYGNSSALEEVRKRFSYIFTPSQQGSPSQQVSPCQQGGGKPHIVLSAVSSPVSIGGLRFTPIPIKHGILDILGWRIDEDGGNRYAVYLTDLSAIPASSLPLIGEPEILIIDGLRARPHETHFTFEQALDTARSLRAKQCFLTHICHENSHRQIQEYCEHFMREWGLRGISMQPAWDGLAAEVEQKDQGRGHAASVLVAAHVDKVEDQIPETTSGLSSGG